LTKIILVKNNPHRQTVQDGLTVRVGKVAYPKDSM